MSILGALKGIGLFDRIFGSIDNVLDQVIVDKDQRDQVKLQMRQLEFDEETLQLRAATDIIKAEAQSEHTFTTLARPSVMLALSLVFVMGVVVMPVMAVFGMEEAVAKAVGLYWAQIPEPFYDLAAIAITGYVAGRSTEKIFKIRKQ